MTINQSHIIGPTWQRDDDGHFILPKYSLGWGVINWLYQYVLTPGGPNACLLYTSPSPRD